MSLLVVGSIALDTVKTPVEEHGDLLGGSASYAASAASYFSPVQLVGVVGSDFPQAEFALLANIAPALQSHVLKQMEKPRFVVADTMDLWIETTRAELDALLPHVDLLILNDSEAREMTKETSLIKAGRGIRKMGPRYVAIKKGEHGALLFGKNEFFSCGAYPLEDIHDPTGAGDTFAGGMAGYLAGNVKKVTFTDLRKAMIYGSVLASFCVEAFSLERLRNLTMDQINERYETFKLMSQFEVPET